MTFAPLTSTPYPATYHPQVYVMPWLWYARVGLYLLLSMPGYFTAYDAGYMPGLIGTLHRAPLTIALAL